MSEKVIIRDVFSKSVDAIRNNQGGFFCREGRVEGGENCLKLHKQIENLVSYQNVFRVGFAIFYTLLSPFVPSQF